jgi:hypothetical protein
MRFSTRHSFALGACFLTLTPLHAGAQRPMDLIRFHGIGGVLQQGNLASAEFIADFSGFPDGSITTRTNGALDVDPSFWGGIEGTYRLNKHFSVGASWMHSRGRLRVTFPALSRDPGEFDLEGFVLAASDFQQQIFGGSRAERAMSDALTDFFLVSAKYELSPVKNIFFPYGTIGGGLMRQVSDGPVFRIEYEGALPAPAEFIEPQGGDWERDGFGLPHIFLDETNAVATIGGGIRVALGSKWSADVQLEDLIRIKPGLESLEGSVPPPNLNESLRVFAVTVTPEEANLIHNFGIRVSFGYALWPYGAPR